MDECNVFVKYLPPELTDAEFYQLFKGFGAILSHKIMIDQRTGKSLGYGFVRYGHSSASQNAIKAMNGVRVSNKRLLCKLANISPSSFSQEAPKNPVLHSEDPSDNLYIKPLLKETTEEDLFNLFIPFGPISECKVMLDRFTGQSRQIGFVRYYNVEDARKAKEHMNNYKLDGHSLPLTVKYADNKEQKIARRALKPKPSLPLPPQPTELAPPHPLQLPFAYPVMPFYPPLFPYPPLLSHDMFAPTSSYSVPFFPFDPYQPQNWNEPMATPIDSSLQSDYFEGLPDGTLNIQSLYLDDNHQNGAHPLPYSNFPTLQNTLPDEP
uniref:RRM domain-containing protein n=1 Tax=Arcella intermedia TaxID=1963864 RepID=A0A6B2LA86_9EUKA